MEVIGAGIWMFIIKFGGSVITNKGRKNTFEKARIQRLASEISGAGKSTIIVHGAGSFGHILAKEFSLHEGFKSKEQIRALTEVQRDVKKLNLMVLDAFLDTRGYWEQDKHNLELALEATESLGPDHENRKALEGSLVVPF